MPPQLALGLCFLFIGYLLVRDIRSRRSVGVAIWIPTLWVTIIASRPLSLWFSGGLVESGPGDALEGSPIDRSFYLLLIVASFLVLLSRGINWNEVISKNSLLAVFYLYVGLSIFWSDFPFVTFKRWFKDLGNVLVLLVILTEKNPYDAILAVYLRCGYVLIPLSVVFIKYLPELGRAYTRSGIPMVTGVTSQKNSLGQIVMVVSFFLVWEYLRLRAQSEIKPKKPRIPWSSLCIVLMGIWLIHTSQSKTALVCLLVCLMLLASPRLLSGKLGGGLLFGMLAMPAVLLSLQSFASFLQPIVEMLGRDLTFTGRTDIWKAVLDQPINPVFGAGYLSFWDGPGGDAVFEAVELKGSHNGFMEVYLDGGLIGLGLLYLMLVKTGLNLCRRSKADRYVSIRFAFLIAAILYNLTEGMFGRLGLVWFTTLMVILEVPRLHLKGNERIIQAA